MVRRTLLVVFSSTKGSKCNNAQLLSELFRHFYKVPIDEIPNNIPEGIFSSVIHDPSSKDLLMSLHADTLVFILSASDKVGYIGVSRDAFSRQWSIELPAKMNWDELVECAKQTPQSPISFN